MGKRDALYILEDSGEFDEGHFEKALFGRLTLGIAKSYLSHSGKS